MGGTDHAADQFDRADRARRSSGSLGEVLVRAEACEQGRDLDTPLVDSPLPGGRPRDDDGRDLGPIRLGDAFRRARNAAMASDTGRRADFGGAGGKTGTTDAFGDA